MPPNLGLQGPLRRVIRAVLKLLSDPALQPHRATLIGGLAVSILVKPRYTADVDFLITDFNEDILNRLIEVAPRYRFGFRVENPLDFARRHFVVLLLHLPTGIAVDIALGFTPFEKGIADRAFQVEMGQLALRVATPQDLLTMKLVSQRPIDIIDIRQIMLQHPDIDLKQVLYWVREFAQAMEAPEVYQRALQILEQSSAEQTEGGV